MAPSAPPALRGANDHSSAVHLPWWPCRPLRTRRTRRKGGFVVIKYVYEIDYPLGEKRKYLEWVRSIADKLQAPGELRRLASYDNAFSASPHRVIEFTFESMAEAGRYVDRKEMVRMFQGELPAHGEHVHIK